MAANFLVEFIDQDLQLHWLMNQDLRFSPDQFVSCTPQVSGVYRMLNKFAKVIYVGKAKVLPKRFISYFEGNSHRPDLENHIASMQTVFVFEDREACELEYNVYLKYYLPYFNKTSPENSSYLFLTPAGPYQSINPDPAWRRDIQRMNPRVDFIGPFTSTRKHWEILEEFKTVFKIPSCTPAKFKRHRKDGFVCEEGRFDRCKGHCIKTSVTDYQAYWQPIKEIFLNRGAAGKALFKQVANRMPATKEWIGHRSILDTLNLDDNFDLVYLHREHNIACMTIIEVSKGQVIDIRNMLLAHHQDHAYDHISTTNQTTTPNPTNLTQSTVATTTPVSATASSPDKEHKTSLLTKFTPQSIDIVDLSQAQSQHIINIQTAPQHFIGSRDLVALSSKLVSLSNQQLFKSFLLAYYRIVRTADYLADNDMINHNPTKIIVVNSEFTPELAKEYSIALSQICGYKVRLGAKSPSKKLVELAQFNGYNACLQRLGLLGVPIDTKKCVVK